MKESPVLEFTIKRFNFSSPTKLKTQYLAVFQTQEKKLSVDFEIIVTKKIKLRTIEVNGKVMRLTPLVLMNKRFKNNIQIK